MYSPEQCRKIYRLVLKYVLKTGDTLDEHYVYAVVLEMLNKFTELSDEYLDLYIKSVRDQGTDIRSILVEFMFYAHNTIAGLSFGTFENSCDGYSKEFYKVENQVKMMCESPSSVTQEEAKNLFEKREKLASYYEPNVKLKVDLLSDEIFSNMISIVYIYESVKQKIPKDIPQSGIKDIGGDVYNMLVIIGGYGGYNRTHEHPLVKDPRKTYESRKLKYDLTNQTPNNLTESVSAKNDIALMRHMLSSLNR